MNDEIKFRTDNIAYEVKKILNYRKKRKYFHRWCVRILFCTVLYSTVFMIFLSISIFLKDYRIAVIGYLVSKYCYDIAKIIVFHREKDKLILIAFTNYDYKNCRAAIEQMENATTNREIKNSLAIIKAIFQDTSWYYKKIKENEKAIHNILNQNNKKTPKKIINYRKIYN